jgi:hypothetical protein
LSPTDPKLRPLSAPILARFSSHWNSVDLDLAGYIAVAGGRRKDVEAHDSQRRCRWTVSRFSQLKDKALDRTGQVVPIIVIQEAGLDGFWIHRLLQSERNRKPRG